MNLDMTDFVVIKNKGEEFYKTLGEVYCPYFKEKISFNARGLEHLKFIQREKARLEKDQYMRFKLIYLAPEVLKDSHTVQGILETRKFERVRINSRTEMLLKLVIYYEFIAVIKETELSLSSNRLIMGKSSFGASYLFGE